MCLQYLFAFLWPLRRLLLLSTPAFHFFFLPLGNSCQVSPPHKGLERAGELHLDLISSKPGLYQSDIWTCTSLEVPVEENHCRPHHNHDRTEKREHSEREELESAQGGLGKCSFEVILKEI